MVLCVQLTMSTTKAPFHTLPHITVEMWSQAHARYLLGYPKLMSTDSSGRVSVTSSKTWAELEGDDSKDKLADLGRQGWLPTFKKFTLKPHTCTLDIEPTAADIDAWLRWFARSLLRLTRPSQLLRVSCSASTCSCRCPPRSSAADYKRQLAEIGVTMGCLCASSSSRERAAPATTQPIAVVAVVTSFAGSDQYRRTCSSSLSTRQAGSSTP